MQTQLSGGPLALINKLASAPEGFRDTDKGRDMATRALALVRREDPEQADAFLAELVILGFDPRGV